MARGTERQVGAGAVTPTSKYDSRVDEAESNATQCSPPRVRPGRFSFFRYWLLDHRGGKVRWAGSNDPVSSNRLSARSFRNLPERWRAVSKQDLQRVGLLLLPLLTGYVAILSLIAIATPASKWLLPRYFGPDPRSNRPIQDTLTGVALAATFYFVVAVATYIAGRVWIWRWVIPGAARTILRAGKCAACKYPVSNLEAASDGCTVCPECGAAWKLNVPSSERVSA